MTPPVRPIGAFAALLTLAQVAMFHPAYAVNEPNAANLATQKDVRSIALENRSGSEITQAHVQTTDGRVWNLAPAGVSSNHGSEILVPIRDCIAKVFVQLKNGGKLQSAGLHACDNTMIVVRKSGISIPRQAVPGAQQHGTPR